MFVEAIQFGSVVVYFLDTAFVVILVLFYHEGYVGEFVVLLFEPVNEFVIVFICGVGLMFVEVFFLFF